MIMNQGGFSKNVFSRMEKPEGSEQAKKEETAEKAAEKSAVVSHNENKTYVELKKKLHAKLIAEFDTSKFGKDLDKNAD